jgi:hypothetical protein
MIDSNDLKDRLIDPEEKRSDAWLKRDPDALASLPADDFMEINSPERFSRDHLLQEVFLNITLEEFHMENYRLLDACKRAA